MQNSLPRQQKTKVNNRYSNWDEVLFRVPPGSILSPFLINIHMCNMFFIAEKYYIASYAGNNTHW